ncbi:NADPH:quinone reductase-like Zn-dependent oxidoreductase [Actinokineospora baliensis]|uniref:NAD(P)-dependent alcohol dehydrogenase n=1 Tax=Actinokineospora baliensis TaxID=547056 RepID=UPI00195D3F66|nr:NAD(P)-dependent alcohol dehydrogenase [Actinokineospora baliensis]MBM7774449.1 NADPH:quinone reductase-like Zn-dependent oxidoreductase [Actinokineospora baliensis]
MRAVVQDEYGEAHDVLRVAEIDQPVIAADEVLVRVHAAGVDRGAWHLMAGMPYPVRMATGLGKPKTPVRGRDLAGRVEAVGAAVTTLSPGDEVFGIGEGSFAEFARAKAAKLVARPENLTPVQAAALPISGLTALQSVRDRAKVQAGQKVLVIGASGGVGAFAVQVAKARGAHVTGLCSTAKVDLVRSLGADEVLDYTKDPIGGPYDVIIDTGGHRTLRTLRRALTPRGHAVIVGSETGGRILGGFQRALWAPLMSLFISQKLLGQVSAERQEDLQELATLAATGTIFAPIDRTYPLEETAAAIQQMQDGKVRGKVVVVI